MTTGYDVITIGGDVTGLLAGLFTAQHGLHSLVVDSGESIIRRNLHLENFPGFPVGVNPRQLLDLTREQAEKAGCKQVEGTVTSIETTGKGFRVETSDSEQYRTEYVIYAIKNTTRYLDELNKAKIVDRGETYIDTDERSRTGAEGLYVAGRLAEKPHQAIICAGYGAKVAVTLLEDDNRPFYHDWMTPAGYFTGHMRDLPPECEEIEDDERQQREQRVLETMRDRFTEPHPAEQVTHPSLGEV